MLPQSYELPAQILLVLSGVLACFAGYRLFRVVLTIYGFILGAMMASSTMGVSSTLGMVLAALLGGIVGALILVFAYFVGIGLVGAGFGALVAHVGWPYLRAGDPSAAVIIALAIVGAIAAMLLQRYVIIVATAFGGAWTMIVGGAGLAGDGGAARVAQGTPPGDVWILYPMTPAPAERWVPIAWVLLGFIGTAVQLRVTGRKR